MNILITGSSGFIGKSFAKRLKDHKLTLIDIKEGKDCRDFFKESLDTFDLIIHCAANVGGRQNIDGSPLAVATNISIDVELFQWAIKTKQKRIVYFSSSAAYPIHMQTHSKSIKMQEGYINFNNLDMPDMTYGWSKLTGEYLSQFAIANGVAVHTFRPFSGYGPGQSLDYPFPSLVQRAMNKDQDFIIWGNGEQVRDFIHVEDILDSVLFAIENNIFGPINLGTGIPTSFTTLAKQICKVLDHNPTYTYLTDKPTGVEYRVADISNMEQFYTPKISLLDGIVSMIKEYHG
jgi:nucleoside-diphosphate-sugar epimerase